MVALVTAHGGRAAPGWWDQIRPHSLGWVTARQPDGTLAGFGNVAWDGADHAFLLYTKVAHRKSAARDRYGACRPCCPAYQGGQVRVAGRGAGGAAHEGGGGGGAEGELGGPSPGFLLRRRRLPPPRGGPHPPAPAGKRPSPPGFPCPGGRSPPTAAPRHSRARPTPR